MKNAYTTISASLVLAFAALSAGSAMAADAADTKIEPFGESPRQMFPAQYGVKPVAGKTTEQVRAELTAANTGRDAADTKLDVFGQSPRQMFPAQNGVAVAEGKTSSEVRAELSAARANRDAADTVWSFTGQSLRQMFPASYPKAAPKAAAAVVTTASNQMDKPLPIHTSL